MTTKTLAVGCRAVGPKQKTIKILQQFARAYMPTGINAAPVVLN